MRWAILFLIIFMTSMATAVPILTFQNEEIRPGETIFGTIETAGEFTQDITKNNVKFLEGRKEVFFEYEIKHYKGIHYFYAYTTRAGNFTLKISNVLYKEANQLKSEEIEKNFTIEMPENETEVITIKPGFSFEEISPKITITNKGTQTNITYNKLTKTLSANQIEEIDLKNFTEQDNLIISSYKDFSIPIIILKENISIPEPEKKDLRHEPKLILMNLILGEKTTKEIQLLNLGSEEIANIEFNSEFDFINVETAEILGPRGQQNLTITFNPTNPGHILGDIVVSFTQNGTASTYKIPLSLFILPKGSTAGDFKVSDETCAEKGGDVCTLEETCNGTASFTRGGEYCCMGTCKTTKGEGSSSISWIIGILIFIVIAIVAFMIYKRSKKAVPKKPEEKLRETTKGYSQRIKGGIQRS